MDLKTQNTNAYILAGGKSSRMGTDKGLLVIKGKAMIQYVIEQLLPIFSKVIIVSNNPEYEKFGLQVIPDLIKDIGPAGGIYTALDHSDVQLNFIVSCDMPFVTNDAIQFIFKNRMESQIVLLNNSGNLEPLFGLYATNCKVLWLQLINQKIIKLQEMVLQFNLQTIVVEDNSIFKQSFFENINTKQDFNNALNLIYNANKSVSLWANS
jgi:molybdopterin-guanine dinucleotide biosynthesis protein A